MLFQSQYCIQLQMPSHRSRRRIDDISREVVATSNLTKFRKTTQIRVTVIFLRIIFKVIGIYYFHLPPNVAKQISTCGSVFTKTLIMYLGLFYYDFSFITFFLVAIF